LNLALGELKHALQTAINAVRILGPEPAKKTTKPSAAALEEIPAQLAKEAADQIRAAAEMGDVTRIKTIAEEFRSKSEAFAPIADRIIQMTEDFDFDGILKFANNLNK